jgi:hypothetical protein
MAGTPAAFQPDAFQNDAFQTGAIAPVSLDGGYGRINNRQEAHWRNKRRLEEAVEQMPRFAEHYDRLQAQLREAQERNKARQIAAELAAIKPMAEQPAMLNAAAKIVDLEIERDEMLCILALNA